MRNLEKVTQEINGFEYHPCKTYLKGRDPGDEDIVEQCEPEEAEFWSVYAHCASGGLQCIADFDTENECIEFIKLLESIILNYEK